MSRSLISSLNPFVVFSTPRYVLGSHPADACQGLIQQLFRKILRTSDIKSSNSHNLTEDEREQNKGRAQILNVINGDVFTVAVAGKKVWHVTNAFGSLFIGTAFLYYMLGVSALIGIASVLLAAPFSYWLGKTIYSVSHTYVPILDTC